MCITMFHNFCLYEGCVCIRNSEDDLENEAGYIPLDITTMAISGNSVLRDIIAQVLSQRALERPSFN